MANLNFGAIVSRGLSETAHYARRVEELGYDGFGAGEHVMLGQPVRATGRALTTLAVAGGATTKLQLITSIVLLPLYHPVWLAKETSVLDATINGRLILGVGVGGEHTQEFDAVGTSSKIRGRKANEMLEVLPRLWSEEDVSYTGTTFSLDKITLKPQPMQKPGPPIWVAGRKEPAMRRAAHYGNGWYPYLYSPEQYRDSVTKIKQFADEEGRDLSNFSWGLYQSIYIDETVEKAAEAAASRLGSGYNYSGNWVELVGRNTVLGPPERCIERLQEYIDAGARYILFAFSSDLDTTMETVIRDVTPHLRVNS
jgi:probable F420-dependent oxidoreductase